MITSIKKSLTYGKNYSFDVKARGYYDYLETKSITKETEDPINITLKEYDGLKYTVDESSNKGVRLNFANTVLPYVSDNKLQKTDYCLANVGQQINFGSAETEEIYENVSFTSPTDPIITDGVVNLDKNTHTDLYIWKRSQNMTLNLVFNWGQHTPFIYCEDRSIQLNFESISQVNKIYNALPTGKDYLKSVFPFLSDKKIYLKIIFEEKYLHVLYYENGFDGDITETYDYDYLNNSSDYLYKFNPLKPIVIQGMKLYIDESSLTVNDDSSSLSSKISKPIITSYETYGKKNNNTRYVHVENGLCYYFGYGQIPDYVIIPSARFNENENIFVLFTTSSNIKNKQSIFQTGIMNEEYSYFADFLNIFVENSKLIVSEFYEFSSDNQVTWDIQPNTGYRIKFVITGSKSVSVGFALIDDHTYDYKYLTLSSDIPSTALVTIGSKNNASTANESFKGSIDFKNIPGAYEVGDVDNADGCIDTDLLYTNGENATFNCFANKNINVLLTDKESYEDYRYLGKVEIKYPDPASKLVSGDRIDNKATVIGNFTDSNNQEYVVAVLDASYHGSNLAFSNEAIDSVLPNYKTYDLAVAAKESATYNMNQIETNYDITTYPAFNHCKTCTTVTFNKKEYTPLLPNAAEVEMINTNWNLITGITSTKMTQCWSSNEKHTYAWRRTADAWYNSLKTKTEYAAIPIIEIPIQK